MVLRKKKKSAVVYKPLPYVIKKNYAQVTLSDGSPFSLDATHPTFDDLVEAIRQKNWGKIPQLVTTAQNIALQSQGLVSVTKMGITYDGKPMHGSLVTRIMEMLKAGKDIKFLLKFADNLYQNPSQHAIDRFYDWLQRNDLPITDDGCFLAYKSVNDQLKDTHTGTVDNTPGQVIMMTRKAVNTDYNIQCATGFHICSKQYGTYGTKILAVKANPKHILSAVDGKMRVTKYEVLMLLGSKDSIDFSTNGYEALEKKLVVEVKKERRELVTLILADKAVQRLIRKKKIKKITIMKSPYARLKTMAQKYNVVPKVGPEEVLYLQAARKAALLSTQQVAKAMAVSPKAVTKLETNPNPSQEEVEKVLGAITRLTGNRHVTFPKPVATAKA